MYIALKWLEEIKSFLLTVVNIHIAFRKILHLFFQNSCRNKEIVSLFASHAILMRPKQLSMDASTQAHYFLW